MLEQGFLVTVNSDDPSYFGGYVNGEFHRGSGGAGSDSGGDRDAGTEFVPGFVHAGAGEGGRGGGIRRFPCEMVMAAWSPEVARLDNADGGCSPI